VGQVGDVCYLAMELLEGEPLDRWLERAGVPPVGEVLRIGRETARALVAAHARGLVHRDVKPANIWLEAPGRRIKLLDFGLARPQTGESGLTDPGMVVGTPMYMAPEQAFGEAVDGRADLFSLGCVLYRMATGRPPFDGKSALAILSAVATQTPPPPGELNPAIPPALANLVGRLLAKQPLDRPASAETVVRELQAIEQTGPFNAGSSAPGQTLMSPGGPPASPADLLWSGVEPRSSTGSAETPPPSTSTPAQTRLEESSQASPSGRQAREAERRQVTVLVCGWDRFESAAYLGLEPEDQAQALRAFQQACARVVGYSARTVVQCDEQGLLACFGYPVAHEDAARRAAETALRLLGEAVALGNEFVRGPAPDVRPWVGLNTGPAVVEVKGGAVSLVGDARNVAVRLRDVAVPGQVICSEATHRLFREQVECTALGEQKIRGLARPVGLYRVERVAAPGVFEPSASARLSPLTGRDLEISLLRDRWERAQDGTGQVMVAPWQPDPDPAVHP
jgi:class 3 adenylate cyclase